VFYYDSGVNKGLASIIVMLEGGGYYKYDKLTPEKAHLLVDLLRNEKPIWIEKVSGLFQVAYEPVGEEELV
jgi:hypothetical protein